MTKEPREKCRGCFLREIGGKVGHTDDCPDLATPQQTTLREQIGLILDDFEIGQYEEGEAEDAILELIEDVAIGAENTGKTNERAWIKEAVERIGSIEKSYRSEAEAIAYTEGIDAMYKRVLKILDA